MFSSPAASAEFFIILLVALIFFAIASVFLGAVVCRAWSSGVVQIGKFPDLKNPTNDRGSYLLARAQELNQPIPLDALLEVKVPPLTTPFGAADNLKLLDDVKINIQGVDLPGIIRSLVAALPATQPIVSATPEPAAAGTSAARARLEWKEPSGERRYWPLVSQFPANEENAENATRQIIDQAIYAIVFYIQHDFARSGGSPKGVQFPNRQALEAYYAGRQHLGAYQRERPIQPAELDEAEKQFRTLYREMPTFVDGLMLLGLTLSEKRNEDEALIIFKLAEQVLSQKQEEEGPLKPDDRKVLFQAMLFHAAAQRKLYQLQTNSEALKELKQLQDNILPLLPVPPNVPETADKLDYLKIYISARVEEAYAHAVDLILLSDKHSLEKNDDDVFKTQIQQRYAAHRSAVEDAEYRIKKQIDAKDSDGKRVQERFLSDLHNAEGYARYRRAMILEEDDKKFLQDCEEARSKLHEAYAVHQNEYTILLNLGLVYADPRCDPENKYIEFARHFLKQSIEIKPLDYYGHELLARLAVRQAYTWGLEFIDSEIINKAAKSADTARKLRPISGTLYALLAQVYTVQWAKSSDDNLRRELEPLIEASLLRAERGDATPVHQATARTQWLFQQSRRAKGDEFKALRLELATALDKAIEVATDDRSWYGKKLLEDANSLKKALDDLGGKSQSILRWPS